MCLEQGRRLCHVASLFKNHPMPSPWPCSTFKCTRGRQYRPAAMCERITGAGRTGLVSQSMPYTQVCKRDIPMDSPTDYRYFSLDEKKDLTQKLTQGLDLYGSPTWARTRDKRINSSRNKIPKRKKRKVFSKS